MFHFKLSTKHPQLVDGLWKFIQIPTSHQPMKSNFPGIQFRVLTVYTETGDFEVPYSKEQKQSNRRPGTERVPAFDPKIEKVLFSKRKDGYLVAIGCCKNGCPPSGVEAIPVDGI